MQRLLYHAPDNPNQESPFDRAIVQVVQGQDVSIVSPYIGVQYLHRLIGMSTSWRLISDVLEWLSATPVRERGAVYEFLKEHDGLVHHYPAIHAKTVVSRVGAYTGSANLTDAGVLRRTEFGVLLTDPDQVREIRQWFDAIWSQTSPPPLQSVLDLIAELDQISHIPADFADLKASQLESGARRVRAKLVKILGHEPLAISARLQQTTDSGAPAAAARLITIVKSPSTAPSRQIQLIKRSTPTLPTQTALLQPGSFDLEAEIAAYVGRNAVGSFTFAELHQAMRRKSPELTRRETYFAILESCASHPRSLFAPDALNRLVYRNGRFVQSSKELLSVALKPLDDMVAEIIDSLSFEESTPGVNVSAAQGISIGTQRIVLEGMLQADFVLQIEGGLKLAPSAQWGPRLKLLERAHSRWATRLTQHNFKRAPGVLGESPTISTSPLSGSRTPDTVLEQALPSREDAIETQKIQIQKRNDQMDMVFSHLAGLRTTFGEKTKVLMRYLKEDLVRKSGLSEEDVKRLLNGTYRMYRSPFLAMVTGNGGTVDIVADLDGNPHLQDLPKTRMAIETSPALRALQAPARPQKIIITPTQSKKAVRVRLDTYNDADEAHLLMAHWIFTAKPATNLRTENELLTMFEASGVSRDTLRRLLFDRSSRFPRLFTLWRKGKQSRLVAVKPGSMVEFSIRLHHASLTHYPNTHSYLKTVVWPSGSSHIWLKSPEEVRAAAVVDFEMNALNDLERKHSSRDKAYSVLINFIAKRIPSFDRFKTSASLVTALTQSHLDRFVIEYLLGIGHKARGQLMRVQEDAYGLFLQTDPKILHSYARSTRFIKRLFPQGTQLHPWLTFNAAVPAPVASSQAPATAPLPTRSAQPELGPLRWDETGLFELDTLYVELAMLFAQPTQASKGESREVAVTKYLKICEKRKTLSKSIDPVLSLDIPQGAEEQLELVIYRGYQEYIHQYPKLQRYLAKSTLTLKEV